MYLYLIPNFFHSDSNKLVESLIVTPSRTNLENSELSNAEDDMLDNQSKLRSRKRKERRKKQNSKIINGVKSLAKEQNQSISE